MSNKKNPESPGVGVRIQPSVGLIGRSAFPIRTSLNRIETTRLRTWHLSPELPPLAIGIAKAGMRLADAGQEKTPNFFEVSMPYRAFRTLPDSDLVVPGQPESKRSLMRKSSAS